MTAASAGADRIELVAVYGAATPPGRLAQALDAAVGFAEETPTVSVRRVDLHETRLGLAGTAHLPDHDAATRGVVAAIEAADGVLIASPVYRASFPGVLKNLLDLTPLEALRGKPVAFIVVGATDHHYLGVDRHLRDVLSWFGAIALPVSVYLSSADFDGGLSEPARRELRDLANDLVRSVTARHRDGRPDLPPLAARYD